MTPQYFFFDTYIGYFLQVLPIALLAGLLYGLRRFARDKTSPVSRKLCASLLVCYLTGLLCLTLFHKLISDGWYFLLYVSYLVQRTHFLYCSGRIIADLVSARPNCSF